MSVTNSRKLVAVVAGFHKARGRTGIQVLTIDTTGPHWDHDKQRIWNLGYLTSLFNLLSSAALFNNEYLIEDSIPDECITSRRAWEDAQVSFDPSAYYERQQESKYLRYKCLREEEEASKKRKAEREDEEGGEGKTEEGIQDNDGRRQWRLKRKCKRPTRFKFDLKVGISFGDSPRGLWLT
ncbi:hypothetical protein SLS62_007280 [Diatrype stigma]|uniref:Uncharacterized protein n=1 Tax=Diatrype stigma TaxID=117547 RepID=A0AAN9ULF9_9PEZI